MDKKTLFLLFVLISVFVIFYFVSKSLNINDFFSFGNYTQGDTASESGRTTFSDLVVHTPTPSPVLSPSQEAN